MQVRTSLSVWSDQFYPSFLPELSALISGVKALTLHTRATRTIIWCAYQLVLANSTSSHENTPPLMQSNSKESTGDVS